MIGVKLQNKYSKYYIKNQLTSELQNIIPTTVSLTMPTETRAALPFSIKSRIVAGLPGEQFGGTTGRES